MKKTAIAAALLCLTATTMPAMADDNVDSGDPCTVFLCMAGKVMGESPSECNGAVKKFFSINAFKKKHRFNPGKTFDMRQEFLGQCASADPATVSKILSRFGKIRG
ncbi:conjugal transfer protein TrbM [Serratia ficaria]|uniref:TrbM/KikA/MpfK family conjugal transfer protein n=1 Tax=Serratia ficaria TaxID=61651 RepID=UPI0021C504C2|nr:TrbM/KikA/MpfK family conjugal transfer protein [Serratia ficaria]CAI2794090.1 conjugal transfer protein TrbM [Serratia ficaria]